MKQLTRFFSALIFLTVACVIPAQQTASPSAPTADTRLESMVALTVSAALEMTQQARPSLTPVPTQTAEPTPTSTPEADSSGSTLIKNDDNSVTFIDESGKYQITVPQELIALRINQQEFLDAWLLPAASNPAVQSQLNLIQKQDPNLFRLFAFDFNEEHIDGGFITNVNFLWDGAELSLEDEAGIVEIAESYTESLPNSEVLTTELITLENGIRAGIITSNMPAVTLDGANIIVYQKQSFFDLSTGTLIITLSTTETWQETIEPLFDSMLQTFNFIE
ncbi:MAG: hypothetical protein JNJ43_16740 [Anaerolineales bacterium]|nr:hypothetical protein [Anaerolineales bacterium]